MEARGRRKDRVLLLAPQNDDTMLLAGLFSTAGYALTTVFDDDAAFDLCARGFPDAVILDLDTPMLDACTLVRRLRALDGGAALCVVAIVPSRGAPAGPLGGVDVEVGRPATVTKLIDALSDARGRKPHGFRT